jgi:hypothetical protein
MGWARKNEIARLYKDTKGTYLLVFLPTREEKKECPEFYNSNRECLAEVMADPDPENPKLCSCHTNESYLSGKKRVAFDEIPAVWQDAFRKRLDGEIRVEDCRGLWRT